MTLQMLPLNHLSVIRITGQDRHQFLQGQLSNDLNALTPRQPLLASCNSAQGRVQAILTLVESEDSIYGILPRSLIALTVDRLRKYILRAKVNIEDASDVTSLNWITAYDPTNLELSASDSLGASAQQQAGGITLKWPDPTTERYLTIQPIAPVSGEPRTVDIDAERRWLLADIRAGLPQVFPETHEQFVAQMLNLDVLGGISFNKGCYTGQEIIARAHFRGTVKRRMFRFTSPCEVPPPGTKVLANGEHAGEVVISAQDGNHCEFLAVISLSYIQDNLILANTHTAINMLPLPYNVPN